MFNNLEIEQWKC